MLFSLVAPVAYLSGLAHSITVEHAEQGQVGVSRHPVISTRYLLNVDIMFRICLPSFLVLGYISRGSDLVSIGVLHHRSEMDRRRWAHRSRREAVLQRRSQIVRFIFRRRRIQFVLRVCSVKAISSFGPDNGIKCKLYE